MGMLYFLNWGLMGKIKQWVKSNKEIIGMILNLVILCVILFYSYAAIKHRSAVLGKEIDKIIKSNQEITQKLCKYKK